MELKIEEKDRDKVLTEISECQGRILQTLIPTIISVGLISIADRKNIALITLFSAFSVLFASSIYVASLSYKIFRNATFIRALTDHNGKSNTIHWEKALSIFVKRENPPFFLGYETRTISIIYLVFSLAYIFIFYGISSILSVFLGVILALVSIRIYFIPEHAEEYYLKWKKILKEHSCQ